MKVGRRLQRSAETLAAATSNEPCKELVVGFDGGYVRNRHRRPERNFEVVAGKALDRDGLSIAKIPSGQNSLFFL
jgi:hypothetical protein